MAFAAKFKLQISLDRLFVCNFYASCGEDKNPKSEARNSKQYSMVQIQMTKTHAAGKPLFGTLAYS
jgi:hypothetical protein